LAGAVNAAPVEYDRPVGAERRPRRAAERLDRIARVLWGLLWLNLLVAAAKLIYGYRSGALALTADGLHSLLDSAANVIGIIGVRVARRPPDDNHPYGHRKYETFAALAVGMMLFLGCYEILGAALARLREPRPPQIGPAVFAILGGTIAINVFVVWLERRQGRKLQSELLLSDAAHTGSDVLASAVVLVSFLAVRAGLGWADLLAALLIVALIARAGVGILKGTLSTLSDERRIPPAMVESVALEEPGVREVHNVRSRGARDDVFLDLHVLVDPAMPIARAHALGHRVELRVREHWPVLSDVVVHVEPALASERARVREGGGLKEDSVGGALEENERT
jgi:cation diffusion facilitator family transporter